MADSETPGQTFKIDQRGMGYRILCSACEHQLFLSLPRPGEYTLNDKPAIAMMQCPNVCIEHQCQIKCRDCEPDEFEGHVVHQNDPLSLQMDEFSPYSMGIGAGTPVTCGACNAVR